MIQNKKILPINVPTPQAGTSTMFVDLTDGNLKLMNSDRELSNIGSNSSQTLIPKDVSVDNSHIGRLMVWDIETNKAKVSFIEGGSPGVTLDYKLRVASTFTAPTSATWEIIINNLPSDGQLFKLANPINNSTIETYIAKTSPTLPNEFAIGGSISDSVDNLAVLLASSSDLQYESKTSNSVLVTVNVLSCHLGTLGGSNCFVTDGSGTFSASVNINGNDNDWNQSAFLNNTVFVQTYMDSNSFININYDDIFNPSTNGGIGSNITNGRNFPSTIEEQRDMIYNVLYTQLDNANVPSSRFLFAKNSTNDIDITTTNFPSSGEDYLSIQYLNNTSIITSINGVSPIPALVYKPILGVLKSIIGNDCIIEKNIFYSDLIIAAGGSSIDTSSMTFPEEINLETCLIPYENGTVMPLKDIWDWNFGNPPSNFFYWILNYSPYTAMENSATDVGERTIKCQTNYQFYLGN